MTMAVLRNPDTLAMVCVDKSDDGTYPGYPGYVVLAEQEGLPPEHASWVDGEGWVVDEAAAAAAAEAARLNSLSRADYMAEINAKLAKLGIAQT